MMLKVSFTAVATAWIFFFSFSVEGTAFQPIAIRTLGKEVNMTAHPGALGAAKLNIPRTALSTSDLDFGGASVLNHVNDCATETVTPEAPLPSERNPSKDFLKRLQNEAESMGLDSAFSYMVPKETRDELKKVLQRKFEWNNGNSELQANLAFVRKVNLHCDVRWIVGFELTKEDVLYYYHLCRQYGVKIKGE